MSKEFLRRNLGSIILICMFLAVALVGCKHSAAQEYVFTPSPESGNIDAVKKELLNTCCEMPEVLASTMSAFPEYIKTGGFYNADPLALDKACSGENGYECRERLEYLLHHVLDDDQTELVFGYGSGDVKMTQMRKLDASGPDSPDNFELFWEDRRLKDAKQLRITHFNLDGEAEVCYLDLSEGFTRCVPAT